MTLTNFSSNQSDSAPAHRSHEFAGHRKPCSSGLPARAHHYGLAVVRYSGVSDTPLQDSESVPAQLAPEGINVKKAHQTFKTVPSGCSSDIVAGTLGTKGKS